MYSGHGYIFFHRISQQTYSQKRNLWYSFGFYIGIVIVAIIVLLLLQVFADTILSVKD